MQESSAERAANAIRELDRQLRSQHIEIYHRDQGLDKFAVPEKMRELKNYGRMVFPDPNCGKASTQLISLRFKFRNCKKR